MSAEHAAQGSGLPPAAERRRFEARQWRQLALITLAAIAIFLGLRMLPTGTSLSHMDFRVDPKAGNAIEFCDPLNPQFIPVVAARSPVTMAISTGAPAQIGSEVRASVTLKTSSGKPVAPADLVYTHTRRLHLLIVDAGLRDYQHVHPEPAAAPGTWDFSFTPRAAGAYRVFADFTPAATGRGLYASVDLNVRARADEAKRAEPLAKDLNGSTAERDGYKFSLEPAQRPARAAQPLDLRFSIVRNDGGPVALEPVMDALAHLVAFDEARSGFAHLHPTGVDPSTPADAARRALNFKLTIPRAGRYVVWAQLNIAGRETFVPFALDVVD